MPTMKTTRITTASGAVRGSARRRRGAALALAAVAAVTAVGGESAQAVTPPSATTPAPSPTAVRGVDVSALIAQATRVHRALKEQRALNDDMVSRSPVVTTLALGDASHRTEAALDAYQALSPLGAEGRLRDAEIALRANLDTRRRSLAGGTAGFRFVEYPQEDVQAHDDLEGLRRDLALERQAAAVFQRDVAAVLAAARVASPWRPAGPDSVRGMEYRAALGAAQGVSSWDCDGLPRAPWDGAHVDVRWTTRTSTTRKGVVTSPALPGIASVTFLSHDGSWSAMYLDACDLRTPTVR